MCEDKEDKDAILLLIINATCGLTVLLVACVAAVWMLTAP
jgi:hypothetical protein